MDKEKINDFKESAAEFGRKAKVQVCTTAARAGRWAVRNKEMLIASVPFVIAGVKASQTWMVNKRVKDERKRIDTTFYEPRSGFHWELRRKATNADRAEIARRTKEGEDTYNVLKSLKLV